MKALVLFILSLFVSSVVTAASIDLTCPEEVEVNKAFSCEIELVEGSGVYDVKLELKQGSETVGRILEGEIWKSSYYYLKEFISVGESKDIEAIITKQGTFNAVLKLRQAGTIETFDFALTAASQGQKEDLEEFQEVKEETFSSDSSKTLSSHTHLQENDSFSQTEAPVLVLNEAPVVEELENDAEETFSFPYKDYFWRALVLIVLIVIVRLTWEKF